MIEAGCPVNPRHPTNGRTPLHAAAEAGLSEFCRLLTVQGADTEVKDEDGRSPLHLAVIKDSIPTCQVLIYAGSDITVQDNHGLTPEDYAAKMSTELVSLFENVHLSAITHTGNEETGDLMNILTL